VAETNVTPGSRAEQVRAILASPEVAGLVADLEATRWTGRRGYPVRTMVGLMLAKSVYAIPTMTRTVALVREHASLRAAFGCLDNPPSVHAAYRFAAKVREHSAALDACLDRVVAAVAADNPAYGRNVAIDGSDMPAYANGQRFVSKGGRERERFSDPDATWGHRSAVSTRKGGGYYGFKLHAAVCTATDLPVVWRVETAKSNETTVAMHLLDRAAERGIAVEHAVMDKGYDVNNVYDGCEARGIRPIIPLRQTGFVVAGKHRPPTCEHGTWTFAGSDAKRGASKWRCPTGECSPASRWIRADRLHTLVPRTTDRWRTLYRSRAAVEREFGRLKHSWGLAPLRVRGLDRVRLHADLTILARLACHLADGRATVPLAA
jgi:hypothetical protein